MDRQNRWSKLCGTPGVLDGRVVDCRWPSDLRPTLERESTPCEPRTNARGRIGVLPSFSGGNTLAVR
jgi:hypothetical protein